MAIQTMLSSHRFIANSRWSVTTFSGDISNILLLTWLLAGRSCQWRHQALPSDIIERRTRSNLLGRTVKPHQRCGVTREDRSLILPDAWLMVIQPNTRDPVKSSEFQLTTRQQSHGPPAPFRVGRTAHRFTGLSVVATFSSKKRIKPLSGLARQIPSKKAPSISNAPNIWIGEQPARH